MCAGRPNHDNQCAHCAAAAGDNLHATNGTTTTAIAIAAITRLPRCVAYQLGANRAVSQPSAAPTNSGPTTRPLASLNLPVTHPPAPPPSARKPALGLSTQSLSKSKPKATRAMGCVSKAPGVGRRVGGCGPDGVASGPGPGLAGLNKRSAPVFGLILGALTPSAGADTRILCRACPTTASKNKTRATSNLTARNN